MSKPITLVHLSDLHFTSQKRLIEETLQSGQFQGKRHLGRLNYQIRRKKHFLQSTRQKIHETISGLRWDYLIITGDLTSLSLNDEFQEAENYIASFGNRGKILLTPGNHDRYFKEKTGNDLISRVFSAYWPFSDEGANPLNGRYLELDDDFVVVEFDMAIPRPFYSSKGILRTDLKNVENRLKNRYKNWTKIAIGHYPAFLPPNEHEGYFHALPGKKRLQKFLVENDFSLYLHGHVHKSWCFNPIEGKKLTCVNSGGCCKQLTGEDAGFHKITLAKDAISVERIKV